MKVSLSWLKELVDYSLSPKELADKLSLTSIGVKEQTKDCLELDLTYNRGDLLSLRGVAREISAVTGSKLAFSAQNPSDYPWENSLSEVPVQIDNTDLCPVYCVAKIEGLKVESSSEEWVKKLKDSGIRSVNNVADVTNLLMLEYGQPMHAFDGGKVMGSIEVRVAEKDEQITTLDGKIRNLTEEDLLITDNSGPIGIAGIMGGKDSEVSEETTSILLEAAIFDPILNRKTSTRLGLYSEASKRFQHGLSKTNLLEALFAAVKLYESLGGKLTAITLTGNLKDEIKTLELTQEKINSLIGINIPAEETESSLEKLGFTLASKNQNWQVTVPYWRNDINGEEDLIEEVARMYGYEKIPPTPLKGKPPQQLDQNLPTEIYDLKNALSGAGLTEVQTYSFYSSSTIRNLSLNKNNLVKIANPISSETEYLRNNLWPNLLEVVNKNLKTGHKEIAIFELGKTYLSRKGDLPEENYYLSITLVNETDNPIQELYQILQAVMPDVKTKESGSENDYFHPTRFATLEKEGKQIGWIAEIHPRITNKFGIEKRVAVLEVRL